MINTEEEFVKQYNNAWEEGSATLDGGESVWSETSAALRDNEDFMLKYGCNNIGVHYLSERLLRNKTFINKCIEKNPDIESMLKQIVSQQETECDKKVGYFLQSEKRFNVSKEEIEFILSELEVMPAEPVNHNKMVEEEQY